MLIFRDKLMEELAKEKTYKKTKEIVMSQPALNCDSEDFGAVLNCAIRYSLGRQTYMPHLVMDFIRPLLPHLSIRTLSVMIRDIESAGSLGDTSIDEPAWREFLAECIVAKQLAEYKR